MYLQLKIYSNNIFLLRGPLFVNHLDSVSFTAKSQELKKDIEILSQTFERVIDRKEAIIKSLVKDIEEAEEQYQMALRSHLQNVDRLIGK